LPVSDKKLSFEFKAKRFMVGAELGIPDFRFFRPAVLFEDVKTNILDDHRRFNRFSDSAHYFRDIFAECDADSDLNRLLYIDTSCHLPHDLMVKNDRMTMAYSIEARVPYTDVKLSDFSTKYPQNTNSLECRKGNVYPVYNLEFEDHLGIIEQHLYTYDKIVTLGRQGLFVHDNTHHAMEMGIAAADCLSYDVIWNKSKWGEYKSRFAAHVVVD